MGIDELSELSENLREMFLGGTHIGIYNFDQKGSVPVVVLHCGCVDFIQYIRLRVCCDVAAEQGCPSLGWAGLYLRNLGDVHGDRFPRRSVIDRVSYEISNDLD